MIPPHDSASSVLPDTRPLDFLVPRGKLTGMTVVEDDLELGETDSEEEQLTYLPAERKVVTQAYDLSVQTLVEQWNSKLLILPEIQREYVWDDSRASRLIESLILNIPIPVLYFAETDEAKYEIIDGHQRIRSIVRFLGDEFPLTGLQVLTEYKRLRMHKLPPREQRFLKMRTLRAIIIAFESHPSMKFEIFERLNSGSIVLNAQELRNSMYRGTFNRLLHDLTKNAALRTILGGKMPRKHMVDEELLLRFFALHARLDEYRPPLKRFLNNYMDSLRGAEPLDLELLATMFESTVQRVMTFVGAHAFRLTDASGKPLEKAVNRALFDSQMLAFSWVMDDARASRKTVLKALDQLYQSPDFLDSIRRATSDRSRTRHRVREMAGALQNAGLRVAVPAVLQD